MTESDATAFCRHWLALWTGNRPEALLACYAETAFYRDPGQPRGLTGIAALRPYFTALLAANPDWQWDVVEVMPTAAGFTLKWRARIPVGATTIEEEGLDIVEVDAAGRITRNEVYFDRVAWKKAHNAQRSLQAD